MNIESRNHALIVAFLRRHGIVNPRQVAEICSGFDLGKPVVEQRLEEGERLFQFVRNEESGRPLSRTGNWFCIPGGTMDGLAIFGGGAGRRKQEFRVKRLLVALEGVAGPMRRNWGWAGGGRGGATQLFLPGPAVMALEPVGTHFPD